MRIVISALLLVSITGWTGAQYVSDYEEQLYSLYVKDRITEWEPLFSKMKAEYMTTKQPELLYELCFAQYGYIGYCISKEMDDEAKACLKSANENVNELEKIYKGRDDILALQGAFIGYQIMLSKFTALYLGPKAFRLIREASASSDIYFNCSMEFGNLRYFTPGFLGGSKEEAIAYYENAVDILEKSSGGGKQNWLYINSMLLLANACYDTGSNDKACTAYARILEYEPAISWVRDEMNSRCGKQSINHSTN